MTPASSGPLQTGTFKLFRVGDAVASRTFDAAAYNGIRLGWN